MSASAAISQRDYLKDVLENVGRYEGLVGLWEFFCKILCDCSKLEANADDQVNEYFVAYMTRRCHVLLQIFRNAVDAFSGVSDEDRPACLKGQDLSKWRKIITEHFITDTALIAMTTDFAQRCITSGKCRFPQLIIVDELMIHGRSLNNLLYKMEKNLRGICERAGLLDDRTQEIRDSFLHALELRIYMKNARSNLLLKRYAQQQNGEALIRLPPVWRRFSFQCTRLIYSYTINNVSFSWGLSSPVPEEEPFLGENASSDFRMTPIELEGIFEQNYIWLYPNARAPKAICAVRAKFCTNQKEPSPKYRLSIPFIIHDHLSFDALWQLHGKIMEDFSADDESDEKLQLVRDLLSHYDERIESSRDFGEEVGYRWISETNDLVLNALLMKKFHKDFPDAKQDVPCYDQLARNFIFLSSEKDNGKIFQLVRDALEVIWEWTPDDPETLLRCYLDQLLDQVPSFESEAVFGTPGGRPVNWGNELERSYVIFGVQDAISEIAYGAERNAYERYSNSFDYSDRELTKWGRQYSLSAMLPEYQKYLTEYLEIDNLSADLYQVMAVMIYAMDYGLIGMHTTRTRDSQENSWMLPVIKVKQDIKYFTVQHAGEAALFILPRRYRLFLPVLADIQSWRGNDPINARLEIARFLQRLRLVNDPKDTASLEKNYPLLEKKLSWLFYLFFWTGQQYRDWNFLFDDDLNGEEIKRAKRYLNIYRS